MPEGPEVRKYADALDAALSGRAVVSLEARTKDARKWLQENEPRLIGRRVERVVSHGKHLIGYIEGNPKKHGLPPQHWSFVKPYHKRS